MLTNNCLPTVQDIIDKYSSKLRKGRDSQPQTVRKQPSSSENSLSATFKPKIVHSRNGSGLGELNLEENGSSLRRVELLERELVIVGEHLQLALDQRDKAEQRYANLQQKFTIIQQEIQKLEDKLRVCQQAWHQAQKTTKKIQQQKSLQLSTHLNTISQLQLKLQLSSQQQLQKSSQIQLLNKRLLLQQQDYLQLSKANSLLKQKLSKQVQFIQDEARAVLSVHQKRLGEKAEDECHRLHIAYGSKEEEMRRETERMAEEWRRAEELSRAQIERLLKEKEECERELGLLRQDLGRLEGLYQGILAHKEQEFRQCLEEAYRQLHNDTNQQHFQQKLKDLMSKLCTAPAATKITSMLDKELEKLRENEMVNVQRIGELERELIGVREKLGRLETGYDLTNQKLREVEKERMFLAGEISKYRVAMREMQEENQQHIQANRVLKQQLQSCTLKITQLTTQTTTLSTTLSTLTHQHTALQQSHTACQSSYLHSTTTLESLILSLTSSNTTLKSQLSTSNSQLQHLKRQNQHLKNQLNSLPELLEQQYRVRIENEREELRQERRKKEEVLEEKEKIYCRLRGIEREYERIKSQVLSVEGVVRIASKLSKRYYKI